MRRKLIAPLFCLAGTAHTANAPATLNENMAAFFAARATSKAAAGMTEKSNSSKPACRSDQGRVRSASTSSATPLPASA